VESAAQLVDPVPDAYADVVVSLPPAYFLAGSALVAGLLLIVGQSVWLPVWLLAVEVLLTILGLFLFGSFKYQIHKNSLTYGMLLVIVATFGCIPGTAWRAEIATHGWRTWMADHLLSFAGLDELVHADTMLFILGLTLFVAVIAQTRLLEGVSFRLLRRYGGAVAPTAIAIASVVALASGILDGVSMIGLTIRTLTIILLLAATPVSTVRYIVIVCTMVTTICGVWLAYGEPPNLIMKANLSPHLGSAFFLFYCAPAAALSYFVIVRDLRRRLRGATVDLSSLDVLDANIEDVRFLQAMRHGEVFTPIEFIEGFSALLGSRTGAVIEQLQRGHPLGVALILADVREPTRRELLAHYVSEELADGLDRHYVFDVAGEYEEALRAELAVDDVLAVTGRMRRRAQLIGALALVPFAGLLAVHSLMPRVPLFVASFAGFLAALPGIAGLPKMRGLAFREAYHEYAEYYFLFPLFLSITLLTNTGFFDSLQRALHAGIGILGQAHVAYVQFLGSTFLSAILDNNIVADFASRALHGMSIPVLRLFAMAQIAGYALGGCWTHIGCAQSVVAFAFIGRGVDARFTPLQWIREITPLILKVLLALTVLIYVESVLLSLIGP
jgi:hypothetical protein